MEAIKRAVAQLGTQSLLAEALGVAQSVISDWASGNRPIPLERCAQIERVTAGGVKCEELRPDIPWVRVRRRPMVDVTDWLK